MMRGESLIYSVEEMTFSKLEKLESEDETHKKKKLKKTTNSAIFVTGLPKDVSVEEAKDYFSRYGVIMEDFVTKLPRIKFYEKKKSDLHKDDFQETKKELESSINVIEHSVDSEKHKSDGSQSLNYSQKSKITNDDSHFDDETELTGEALIVYLREESAHLAVRIVDESYFRPSHMIRVSLAERKSTSENEIGNFKDENPKKSLDQKKAWREHMQRMARRLEWTTNDNMDAQDQVELENQLKERERNQKISIICNLEDPLVLNRMELPERRKFLIELKEDLLKECDQFGMVKTVTITVRSQDEGGCTAAVKFKTSESASNCVGRMNGRFFAGRRLSSWIHDGTPHILEEDSSLKIDEEQRIQEFGQWLEIQD